MTTEQATNAQTLKVWWIPQIPGTPFDVPVASVSEGVKIMDVLAAYDAFQFENRIKPDYSNAGGLMMLEEGEWTDWCDEETGEDDPKTWLDMQARRLASVETATPNTDAAVTDGWSGDAACVSYEFAKAQELRIAELERNGRHRDRQIAGLVGKLDAAEQHVKILSAASDALEPKSTPSFAEIIATAVVLHVCELPDYTSPDDDPDLLTCKPEQLRSCVLRAFEYHEPAAEPRARPTEDALMIAELVDAAEAVINRWDSPLYKDLPATAVFIRRLRNAHNSMVLAAINSTKPATASLPVPDFLRNQDNLKAERAAAESTIDPNPLDPRNQMFRKCLKGHATYSKSFDECPSCKIERERLPKPTLCPIPQVVGLDVDGRELSPGIFGIGKVSWHESGHWRCLADVGGALCIIEVNVTMMGASKAAELRCHCGKSLESKKRNGCHTGGCTFGDDEKRHV